jgi:hypothetical protein
MSERQPVIPKQSKCHANLPYHVPNGIIRKSQGTRKCFRPTCRRKIEPKELYVLAYSGWHPYEFHIECAIKMGFATRKDVDEAT